MELTTMPELVKPVRVGDPVYVVSESYGTHIGLVTCVHGEFKNGSVPCINVVYVSNDDAKRDPFGRQLERMSSLAHYCTGPHNMPTPGRYWVNV